MRYLPFFSRGYHDSLASVRRLLTALALATAAAAVAGAQAGAGSQSAGDKPAPQSQPPVFRSEANFVRVDVYPMSNGQPVLDLRAEDFQLLEDNVPQAVQTFEHVVVRPAGPQELRAEPNTVGQSLQMAANPRSRVFVIFLDTPHVTIEGSWHIREPLVRLIDRILGPDDLVGVMTPAMAASDLTLARKTQVLADGLRSLWPWGERSTIQRSEREYMYEACYPAREMADVIAEMIARRRERLTLEALNELVQYLHSIREERKAILTVSEGWLLYRPNDKLVRLRTDASGYTEPIPGPDPIGVGPDGRITTNNRRNSTAGVSKAQCDADRQQLANIDDDQYFRDIMGEANRANASFYTVDPRGLPVFDTPIGPAPPPPLTVDHAMLRNRLDSLRTLAENTDGLAALNNNDLDVSMKRIANDLTSYYLLGYYSTNSRLDGKFRNIKVNVKRPGVDVRARKGYRAATEKEVSAARKAAAAPVPEMVSTMTSALSSLDRVRPGIRLYLNAVPGGAGESKGASIVWVAGELQPVSGTDPWARGGTADITVSGPGTSETVSVTLAPGDRGFVVPVKLARPVESGSLDVRARLSGGDATPEQATGSLTVDPASGLGRPLLFRRGPATGNRLQPVATFQFSRTDRARLELALGSGVTAGPSRMLDRTGQSLAIPVTVSERADGQTGQRWLTADVTLAALAPGDYAIEVTATGPGGEQRVVTGIRVAR